MKKILSKIKHILEYIVLLLLENLCLFIGLKYSRQLCVWLSHRLGSYLRPSLPMRKNLSRIFPEKTDEEITRIIRDSWKNYGENMCWILHGSQIRKHHKKYIKYNDDIKYLHDFLAQDKGGIIFTAHMGIWEASTILTYLLNPPMTKKPHTLNGVSKEMHNPIVDKWLKKKRSTNNFNINIIERKIVYREISRIVEDKELILLLSDQRTHKGSEINFLGRSLIAVNGAATYARKYDIPILFFYMKATQAPYCECVFYPHIYVDKTDNVQQDIQNTTQKLNNILEEEIKKYPEQWLWLHDRWKT